MIGLGISVVVGAIMFVLFKVAAVCIPWESLFGWLLGVW